MAHRHPKPGDVKTTDGLRLQVAVARCLQRLASDLRVEAHYRTWVTRRDLDRLARRVLTWRDTSQVGVHAAAMRTALFSAPSADDIAALWQVLEAMGVPWPWTSVALLSLEFPCTYINANLQPGDGPPVSIELDIEMVKTATPGRLPPDVGASILLGVDEWYRWKIKVPRDELHELEAEDQARTGKKNWTASRRHSSVIARVQQAESLLERWQAAKVGPPSP